MTEGLRTIPKTIAAALAAVLGFGLLLGAGLGISLATAPAANAADPSVKVLDTAATITDPNWFHQAYAAGFRLYVMHSTVWGACVPWERAQPQLKMALDAGLKIAVYTRDPACWQAGISAAGPYIPQLQFFALDVETGGRAVTRAMVDGVKGMGVRPVIYTGHGMWPTITGGSTAFSDVPLWDADPRLLDFASWTPNHLAGAPVPYGGWNTATTMRIGVQQTFEHYFNGVYVDLNSFNAAFLK